MDINVTSRHMTFRKILKVIRENGRQRHPVVPLKSHFFLPLVDHYKVQLDETWCNYVSHTILELDNRMGHVATFIGTHLGQNILCNILKLISLCHYYTTMRHNFMKLGGI